MSASPGTDRALPDEDFSKLVNAIAAGDAQAEEHFVKKFLPLVRALLLARSRDVDATADLQQDVMIEALCALRRGQIREADKLPAFVAGVARNVLNNHFRQDARVQMESEIPEGYSPPVQESELAEQQRRGMAACALDSLPDLDREILQMTLVDGMKPGIIAMKLNLSPEMVRQRKLRATKRVVEFVRRLSQKPRQTPLLIGRTPR